ncbi:MAG: hypothetical protein K0U52_09820, partial [Gammaproteobacteria bacterium]|nr:hypothetical protein [Gammaproteobacteria bacterium]
MFATYTARTNGRLAHLSPDDYVYKEYGILCGRYSNTTRLTCYILGDSVLYDMKDNWNDQRAVTVIVRSFEGSTIVLDVYINFNIVIANLHNYRPLARHLSTSVKARQPIQQFNNNNIPELPLLDDFTGQLPENMRTALYRYQQADVLWMQKVEHMILQKTPFARQMRYQAVVVPHALREEYPHVPYTHSGNTILFVDTEYQDIHSMFAAKPEDVTQTTYLTRGAMLGNEVGTGKTLTILSLVQSTAIPDILDPVVNINGETRYASRATLLVCSSHLCKQWEQEVKKHFVNKWKIVVIVDKRSHSKYKYRDLIGADLVIVSDSFLTGGYYKEFLVPRGSISGSVQHTSTLFRKAALSNHSRTVQSRNVCFEMIFWNRIVLDEAHESLHVKRRSHSASNTTLWYSLNSNIMEHLHSRFRWAVSGTINLSTNDSIASMAHFLQIESTTVDIGFNHQDIHWEHKTNISEAYRDILLTGRYSHVKRMMFDCMFMRRTVDQVKAEIDLPNLHEQQIMIQLTDVERALYEDMVHRQVSEDELLQLCCHPLIAPRIRQLDQDRSRTQNIQHRGHGQQKKQDVPIMTLTELSKRLLGKHVEELAELMSAQVSIEEKMDVLSGEIDELETMIGSGTLSTVVQKTLEETLQLKRSKQVKLDTSANKVEIKIARVERLVNYLRQVTKRIREDPKCMICLGEDETIHGVTKCGHS